MANLRPWILLVTDDMPVAGSVASLALERLGAAMEARHLRVVRAGSLADGLTIARGVPSYSAVAVDWDLVGDAGFGGQPALAIIHAVRERSLQVPIFLLCRDIAVGDLPLEVIREVREYVHINGETPEFVARRIQFAIKRYEEGLLPPYFRALKQLTEEGTYQWDAPGHMGGAAYLKHPVGAIFHQFFGENIMRADIGISNVELGSWLDITGPPAESQRMAARIFGADWTFYVLAGSSGSNRIVVQAAVPEDAVIAVDRNCHKSLSHAVALTQSRPVYLQPSRNGYGMIGLIPPRRFAAAHLRGLIERSPLAGANAGAPAFAVVTNPTYDGLLYHVDRVVELLGASVPRIHFDEAWYAYGRFHPLYRQRFAMGVPKEMRGRPTLFAVQSTHKMLPAFSMASYVHVSQGERGAAEWATMKEAFMMHGTTSPFYPMIASLDVATAMMAEPTGPTLLREAVADAVAFRKALAAVRRRFAGENQWFFGCFQPPRVRAAGRDWDFADAPDSVLCNEPQCWMLRPGEPWHGLDDEVVADDFCMLDPTKVTILCPGTDARGRLAGHGIPGAVLTKFLNARRLAIARTGDYTVLTLFSIGTTTGKWGSLLETLLSFKRLYDGDAALEEALPELVAAYPQRYRGLTLRGLCDEMHALMTELDLQALANRAGETLPEPVLTPHQAYQQLVVGNTEDVAVDRLAGRIVALMIVPYPPGIPVLMPGERVAADGGAIVAYLRAVEAYGRRFPGFARAVQNVRADQDGRLWARVVVEAAPPRR